MRHPFALRSLAPLCCTLLAAACVQPEYPDDFEEMLQPSTGADAGGAPFAGFEAGLLPGVDAGPGPVQPPQGFLPGATMGGGQVGEDPPPSPVDAAVAPPPPRADASVVPDASSVKDASAAEDSAAPSTGGALSSCSITANTDASDVLFYNGKYGCAVWIGDASKKVIKTFFLATRIASRSGVSTYRSAASGVTVDIVAGATLNAPKQHQYTWDVKGVAPGKYTLNVETKSSGGDATVTVPFELGSAPVMAMGTPAGGVRSASISCK